MRYYSNREAWNSESLRGHPLPTISQNLTSPSAWTSRGCAVGWTHSYNFRTPDTAMAVVAARWFRCTIRRKIPKIRYRKVRVLPPIRKQKKYPALDLTVIHAEERGTPKHRRKIHWKLIADLSVRSPQTRSGSFNGMPCAGRSSCTTRSSNRDAGQRSQSSPLHSV